MRKRICTIFINILLISTVCFGQISGYVKDFGGNPVDNALIRFKGSTNQLKSGINVSTLFETYSKDDGSFYINIESNTYDIYVRIPGIGAAYYSDEIIKKDEPRFINVSLDEGVDFRAKFIDRETNKPIQNIYVYLQQFDGIECVSDKDGIIEITELLPGSIQLQIDSDDYTRWLSEDATNAQGRIEVFGSDGWQINIENPYFELYKGMEPVEIFGERNVKIRGWVFDTNSKALAGATVSPFLGRSGNPLTGDKRFNVQTKDDGSFEMILPSSGKAEYILIAHTGNFKWWRDKPGEVAKPFRTTPGQVINNLNLTIFTLPIIND